MKQEAYKTDWKKAIIGISRSVAVYFIIGLIILGISVKYENNHLQEEYRQSLINYEGELLQYEDDLNK